MLPKLNTIKYARMKLGLTQKKLANLIGVSTSMINQIESGRTNPSYETAKRIFDNLATLEGKSSSYKSGDFCSSIIKLKPSDTLHDATRVMQKFFISQIPVFNGKKIVGIITEDGIIRHLSDTKETDLKKIKLFESLEPIPPIVDYEVPANILVPLIRFSKCILVSKKAIIVGIITIADTLKMIDQ